MKCIRLLVLCTVTLLTLTFLTAPLSAQKNSQDLTYHVYLPLILSSGCDNITGETYGALVVNPPPTDRPAAQHADLNLALRGYIATSGILGLIDYTGSTDPKSPRL